MGVVVTQDVDVNSLKRQLTLIEAERDSARTEVSELKTRLATIETDRDNATEEAERVVQNARAEAAAAAGAEVAQLVHSMRAGSSGNILAESQRSRVGAQMGLEMLGVLSDGLDVNRSSVQSRLNDLSETLHYAGVATAFSDGDELQRLEVQLNDTNAKLHDVSGIVRTIP